VVVWCSVFLGGCWVGSVVGGGGGGGGGGWGVLWYREQTNSGVNLDLELERKAKSGTIQHLSTGIKVTYTL